MPYFQPIVLYKLICDEKKGLFTVKLELHLVSLNLIACIGSVTPCQGLSLKQYYFTEKT